MQAKLIHSRIKTRALAPLALACFMGATMVAPSIVHAQDRSHDRSDDRHSDSQDRHNDSQDRHNDSHGDRHRDRDESHVKFTHSQEERHFDNGITLRHAAPIVEPRFDAFFPHHYFSYPHYALGRDAGRVVISPFSLYVGIFPPYIDRGAVVIAAPRHVFIDVPIYVHGEYQLYPDSRDYYLNRRDDDRWKDDNDLRNTVYDLEDTFKNEDIALLAPITAPGADIAIFSRGRYQYSLTPNDYLDMTRDFLRSVHTTEFTTSRVHRKSSNAYQVFAKHVYQDQDGRSHTVYLCMALERINERWTLTQIDSSPARN